MADAPVPDAMRARYAIIAALHELAKHDGKWPDCDPCHATMADAVRNLTGDSAPDPQEAQTDARTADDPWPAPSPTTDQKIDAILQQLNTLLGVVIQCAACVADARQGGNPQVNLANVIVGGEGLCHNHVDLVGTRLVRRNSSGLILGGN